MCESNNNSEKSYSSMIKKTAEYRKKDFFFLSNSLKQTDKRKHAETFLFMMLRDCIYPLPAAEHKISTVVKRKQVKE